MKQLGLMAVVLATLSACAPAADMIAENRDEFARIYLPDGTRLTVDESRVWATLSEDQRQRAMAFIANGGTLFASLGRD